MINRVSFKYGEKMNATQQAAQKKVHDIGGKLIGIQDIVIRTDNIPGVDRNPARGKIDVNHKFNGLNLALNGKAEYESGVEPRVTKMDMSFKNMKTEQSEHMKYQEKTDIDTNGDGKKDAKGQLIQIENAQDGKTTVMINDKTDVITLIEEK